MKTKNKKLSGYQKLKAENLALKQDIFYILRGEFTRKIATETKWKTIFDTEDAIMAGTPWTARDLHEHAICKQIQTGDIITFNYEK